MDRLHSVSDILADADASIAAGRSPASRVWPTGFPILDSALAGGLRAGELTLLGGPQGLGKTSFVLQTLRNTVSAGNSGVYFSYEHDTATLLQRLIALESADALGLEAAPMRRIREAMEATGAHGGTLAQRLAAIGCGEALERLASYGDRLLLHHSTGAVTDLDAIRKVALDVAERTGDIPFVAIDYLQKIPVADHEGRSEPELVTAIVSGLKDLALDHELPVFAVVAAEKDGLVTGKRLRVHHLRGSSALAYEPDVVLIMNDKYDVVARHHLVYDLTNAERYRNWAVISIEKNRSGPDRIDVEFMKRFEHSRFDPHGQRVSEQLVDERVHTE